MLEGLFTPLRLSLLSAPLSSSAPSVKWRSALATATLDRTQAWIREGISQRLAISGVKR